MGQTRRAYSRNSRGGGARLCAITTLLAITAVGCDNSFNPVGFESPPQTGNQPPAITVLEPNENLAISQGESFIIRWIDSDPDSNALIDIDLVEVDGANIFEVAGGIRENDQTEDLFVVNTEDIVQGTYFVRMTINDEVNSPVSAFAEGPGNGNRIQVTITPPGFGEQNTPPRVFVSAPTFNIGVSQNDTLTITIRPTLQVPNVPNPGPDFLYDPESRAVSATILLDLDDNPTNDDYTIDDDPGNIILRRLTIEGGRFDEIPIVEQVDVQEIPVRQDGLPYLVRATVSDGLSVAHSYAAGRVHVLALVQGSASSSADVVDLAQVGRTLSGATIYGFNPFANLGTKMASALDQDNDGVGDVVMIAQYGNPRNRGNIGEAYLLFGLQGQRFGGAIAANSIATDVPQTSLNRIRGSVFHPHQDLTLGGVVDISQGDDRKIQEVTDFDMNQPYTLGITDVVAVPTLGEPGLGAGCQLPELLFGLPHHAYHGSSLDDDPSDGDEGMYCYPDDLSNNLTTEDDDDPVFDVRYGVAGHGYVEQIQGAAILWYGENNIAGIADNGDTDPCNDFVTPTPFVLPLSGSGMEGARDGDKNQWGMSFHAGIFDYVGYNNPSIAPFRVDPLNAHFGMNVAVLPDIDLNGLPELIISAPRNELETAAIISEFGDSHPHVATRLSPANVMVYMGQDFNGVVAWDSSSSIPFISSQVPDDPSCGNPRVPRFLETDFWDYGAANSPLVSPGWFRILGRLPEDKLGAARSAGDFNLDGPADIMAGAPFYDPELDTDNNGFPDTTAIDAGVVYIVYLRFPFGNITLGSADTPDVVLPREPMLRIFGEKQGDHLGLKQEFGGDINIDGIDDVIIASQDYNANGLTDNGFVGVVFGGQRIDGDRTVSQLATSELNGVRFYGNNTGDMAGADIAGNGDFNGDNVMDIFISAPGEVRQLPGEDKPRRGVVYLIFGGKHLENQVFNLDQVGSEMLPGIVFVGPYQEGTPDAYELDQTVVVTADDCDPADDVECWCNPEVEEGCTLLLDPSDGLVTLRRLDDAAPSRVGFIGDINGDGFDDIMIGNPTADFFDPQQPGTGRRTDTGEIYLIYGNNFGANSLPQGLVQ